VKLQLVRHAKAARRSRWSGPESLRPLTEAGRAQARAIGEALAKSGVARLLSSPALRCRQTLIPLAEMAGLSIEVDERLAEGADPAKAFEWLTALRGDTVVCSHGDVLMGLLDCFRAEGAPLDEEPRCEKGSIWMVARERRSPPVVAYAPPLEVPESDGEPTLRVAVLDLGSTSFHLLVAEATAEGEIDRVLSERVMLRLGSMLPERGRVPEEAARRAVETAGELAALARREHVDLVLPVATAALREAENGRAVAERIGAAVGVPTRIISGIEEARLTFGAFRRRLAVGSRLALGLDLGGGSLELITGDERDVRWETTLPLGTARLHAELVRSDPMSRDEKRAIRARVRALLAEHREAMKRWAPDPCIATGGTVRALARLALAETRRNPDASIQGLFIPADALRELARRLVRSTQEERLRMPGMRRQRADIIPVGAEVLRSVVEEFDLPGLTVSDWGLREGVILEALEHS
jgi:exopolyphosphatase/guanosine-5'-triphosphate,3'-diphosphate pyrophosphatase